MKGAVQPALGAEKWRISMANEKNDELGDLTMRSKQSQIIGLIVALLLPFVVVGIGVAATSSSLSPDDGAVIVAGVARRAAPAGGR
jgi:hypothetical protein